MTICSLDSFKLLKNEQFITFGIEKLRKYTLFIKNHSPAFQNIKIFFKGKTKNILLSSFHKIIFYKTFQLFKLNSYFTLENMPVITLDPLIILI